MHQRDIKPTKEPKKAETTYGLSTLRENPTPEVAVMWSPNTNNDTLSEINVTLKFD